MNVQHISTADLLAEISRRQGATETKPSDDKIPHIFMYSHQLQEFETKLVPIKKAEDLDCLKNWELRSRFNNQRRIKTYSVKLTEAEAKDISDEMTDFPVRTLRKLIKAGLTKIYS